MSESPQWVPSCLCAAPSEASLGCPSSDSPHHMELPGPGRFLCPFCSPLSLLTLSHLHTHGIYTSTATQHTQLLFRISTQGLSTSKCQVPLPPTAILLWMSILEPTTPSHLSHLLTWPPTKPSLLCFLHNSAHLCVCVSVCV